MTDKTPGACQCHEKHAPTYWKGVVREYKDALEKAEKERDAYQHDARAAASARSRVPAALRLPSGATTADMDEAAEPRPRTPDAITDEMIERGRSAYWGPAFGGSVDERVLAILIAALTDPPARPEGAEKVEAVLHQYWSGDIDGDDLADRIAEEMNR